MSSTIVSEFFDRARTHPDDVAFRYKRDGEWTPITWGEYGRLVMRAAGGLRALGFESGDKGAIISNNRYEWQVADLAIESCGGITVPIYQTNSPPQVAYITGHSESTIIFVENSEQLAKVLDKKADLPALQTVIVFDPTGVTLNDVVRSWEALLQAGDEFNAAHPDDAPGHVAAVKPDDLCTIVYTSGTTGPPKGTMLTHANEVWAVRALMGILLSGPGDRRLSYLPLSHIAERQVSHFQHILQGFETWFATSIETLRDDLQACRPTVIFGVPRVWEKFYDGIMKLIDGLPAEQRDLAEQALQLGLKRVEAQQAGTSLPPELEEKYQDADQKLFALVRSALGLDQARSLVSGGGPINPDVLRFFHAIGLPIAEVYGQTEDSGPAAIHRPDGIKIGTVGQPVPGLEIKIAPDGEILVKGGSVSPGYYKDAAGTKELLDDEGWMHSGDIGELDEEGFLRITDRKKDLIITSSGKNIAPQVIENMLKYSPWISQAVVIGDAKPYLVALLTLDREKVTEFAQQKSIPFSDFAELVQHPDVKQLVENAVAEVNAQLARVEQIKKWHAFDREFQMDAGEVTPTLKVRRKTIIEKNADLIDQMYA